MIFPVCYSDKHFVNSMLITNIRFENRKRKVFKILEHLLSWDHKSYLRYHKHMQGISETKPYSTQNSQNWRDLAILNTIGMTMLFLFTCMLGNFSCFCCHLLTFFKINLFLKILSGTLSECQTVWIQVRFFWVQTVCKGYQQTTKVTASKEKIKCVIQQLISVIYLDYLLKQCKMIFRFT